MTRDIHVDHTCSKLVSVKSHRRLITEGSETVISSSYFLYTTNTSPIFLFFLHPFLAFVFSLSLRLPRYLIHRGSPFDPAESCCSDGCFCNRRAPLFHSLNSTAPSFSFHMHPLLRETRKITDPPSLCYLLDRHILSVVPPTTQLFMNPKWPRCCRSRGEVSCAVCIWTT